MQAVQQKIDVDGVSSAWVRKTLSASDNRDKMLENTLLKPVFPVQEN